MASRTFSGNRVVSYEELAAAIAERKQALGDVDLPRNSGIRRTDSKRALLRAIEEAGGKW